MIIVEYIESEKRERRYSDKNVKLRQVETGILYNDAADIVPCPFTYEETDEPIDEAPLDPQQALDAIFGGAE